MDSSGQARGPERRGARSERGRFSLVPPMPALSRPEAEVLDEWDGPPGLFFWQALRDVLLWAAARPGGRRGLFVRPLEQMLDALPEAPEVDGAIRELLALSAAPERAEPARVAAACAELALWAEGRGMKRTATHLAEAAARVEPHVSARSFTAGRLNRRLGDAVRAAMWYSRAARLARVAYARGEERSEVDFANAHLGYGNLQYDLGNHVAAEYHYLKAARAAWRSGRKSLAGMAHHALMTVYGDGERFTHAVEHAQEALRLYPAKHPLFPNFAQDAAHLLSRMAYFSSALLVLERVLPHIGGKRERIMALATIARAAGAVKDHIRFERVTAAALKMATEDNEFTAAALYHIAEGARSFWDWERAERFATKALHIARERTDMTVVRYAEQLLISLPQRGSGDVDVVPPEDSPIDRFTQAILRKLGRRPAPDVQSEAVPPEEYPDD